MPSIKKDPSEFILKMVKRFLSSEISTCAPELAETAAARSLALDYGLTAGPIVRHMLFGIPTLAAYQFLKERTDQ